MASSSTDTLVEVPESNGDTIDIPRYQEPNPFNYTELQKAKRNKAIKDAMKDYPHLPRLWIEWMYDVVENKPVNEVEEIIEKNLWDAPPDKPHKLGGVMKSMEVLDATD